MADRPTGDRDADAIGFFGGSFNPPHVGHVLACHYALMRWGLKKILVVPSFAHPFGKPLPPFEDRMAMCQTAFSHLGNSIEICDIERQMGGVSYTVETVRELLRREPDQPLRLLVGGDILDDLQKWRDVDELARLAPMRVIPRLKDGQVLGGTKDEAALPDVASTEIRKMLAAGQVPEAAVPRAVLRYIGEKHLYGEVE